MSGGLFILLDNPSMCYYPGAVISGRVGIRNDQQETTSGLLLSFTGYGSVRWQERERRRSIHGTDRTENVTRHKTETYCELSSWLLGNGQQDLGIPFGETFYPFSYQLPFGLPASYYNPNVYMGHAKVEYILEARIKKPLFVPDTTCQLFITMLGFLDLNLAPGAAQPGFWQNSKTFGICCCSSEPLTMSVKTYAQGFVPGETIYLTIEGNNASNKQIVGLAVEICETTKMSSFNDREYVYRVAGGVSGPGVAPGASFNWCPQIVMPRIGPTNLGGRCGIIGVEYCLKVIARVDGMSFNLEIQCPILIGTVPFRR